MYFDIEIKKKFLVLRIKKNYRDNYSCNLPEEFYKLSIFLSCLDNFILQLENWLE